MKNTRLTFFLFCLLLFTEVGFSQVNSSDVPNIRLCPEEAQTLKMSDLFTSYRVMSLNGCSYTMLENIIDLGDRFIALFEISLGNSYIAEFDKFGNFKRRIGSKTDFDKYKYCDEIFIEPDGTLGVHVSHHDILNYSLDGKFIGHREVKFEKDYLKLQRLIGGVGDDLYLLEVLPWNTGRDYSNDYWLNIITADGHVVKQFFPLKGMKEGGKKLTYRYEGAIRLYNVYDSYLYTVKGKSITPCFFVDKGKHATLLDRELWYKDKGKANQEAGLSNIMINENQKYVMGSYFWKERNYYFVYDKSNGTTCNYALVEDDILFSFTYPLKYSPSGYFNNWYKFDDQYLYFYYRPQEFVGRIDYLKKHLTSSAWEEFCRKHPDIIKIYNKEDENAYVIISYKFRH